MKRKRKNCQNLHVPIMWTEEKQLATALLGGGGVGRGYLPRGPRRPRRTAASEERWGRPDPALWRGGGYGAWEMVGGWGVAGRNQPTLGGTLRDSEGLRDNNWGKRGNDDLEGGGLYWLDIHLYSKSRNQTLRRKISQIHFLNAIVSHSKRILPILEQNKEARKRHFIFSSLLLFYFNYYN